MGFATGAMGSLLPKLGQLLMEEYKLHKGVKKDVESLSKEMESMQAALRKVAMVPRDQLDEQVKLWAGDVRELSYEMEDVVDSYLVRVDGLDNSDGLKGLVKKMGNLFKKGKAHHKIADAIKDIKGQVQEVATRRDRYRVDDVVANSASTTTIDPRLLALYVDQTELVGISAPRDELTSRLTDDDSKQQLKMFSIFGFGGLGKTTLAQAVYDKLKGKFNCSAFVPVGQNPDVKKFFRDILLALDKQKYMYFNAATFDERQLINELRGLLENKRYIIVIDDLWDIKAWQVIKCALIDNNCGSRIIMTTRIFEVAKKASDDIYKLQPLSRDRSKELFYTRLYGGKGKCDNDEPDEVFEKILRKCGGVPLAIITIASLLANKPREDWSKLYSSIGFGNGENIEIENTRKILLFSFYDLPCHLRTCLLYLSIYPEDFEIDKDILIWKWIAENFVHEESGVGLFEIGERYFNELVNRSMIQPVENYRILRGISGCRVHDMVLDMICLLSKEENFVTIWDSNEGHKSPRSNVRRLTMQKIVMGQCDPVGSTCMPRLRSFNATQCHLSTMQSLWSFACLRVLSLENCTSRLTGDLQPVVRLIQLRYLGLVSTHIQELPGELGELKFLQTLELTGCGISELPQSVGRLKNLKCLRRACGSDALKVPFPIGNLTSLETLCLGEVTECPNFVKELGKLTELRELRINICNLDDSSKKSVVESLCNLQNMQDLELHVHSDEVSGYLEGYVPPERLHRVNLQWTHGPMPAWINPSLLPNLSHLSVRIRDEKDLEVLGKLPELIYLALYMDPAICLEVIGAGAFPKLKSCWSMAPLRFQQGIMPALEKIHFKVWVPELKGANFDFDFGSMGNLLFLQRLSAEIYRQTGLIMAGASDSDVEEAEAGLRQAINSHPSRPSLYIRHGELKTESLTRTMKKRRRH